MQLDPLINPLKIIQADGTALNVIGSSILYLEADVWVQCVKSGKWKDKGVIDSVRVADDGTIKSYAVIINGVKTTRHRRFLAKVKQPHSGEDNREGAASPAAAQE